MTELAIPQRLRAKGKLPRQQDARSSYFWVAPAGVSLKDVQRPDYWKDVADQFVNRWSTVEVVSVSGTWECLLRVITVQADGIEMRLLSKWEQPPEPLPDVPDQYEIYLTSDGWVVSDRISGEEIASRVATEIRARYLALEFDKKHLHEEFGP
ncbi:hypothetical protein ACO2I3_15645 [Leptospira interrogans]